MPNHATRPLGEIERHYCGRCGYLLLSHGAYTLHPCDRFLDENPRITRTFDCGHTIWQSSGTAPYAALLAIEFYPNDILGYDDQQIVMTTIRINRPEFFDISTALAGPKSRRIERPRTVEADFRSTRPVRLGDVLCQDVGNRLRPGRVGDSPHGIVTEVHRSITVADDDVLLRYRWEGTLVFSGPLYRRRG
jgi:hypothetical protein